MRIEFDQTEDDLVAGTAASFRHDPYLRGQLADQRTGASAVITLGLVLLAAAAAEVLVRDEGGPAAVVAGFVGLMMLLFGVKQWPTAARANAIAKPLIARAVRAPTGQLLLGTRAVGLEADRLRITTLFSESFIRWSAVIYIETDDDGLYIGIPGPGTVMVPRQAFETDSRFEAFADAARTAWRANTGGET